MSEHVEPSAGCQAYLEQRGRDIDQLVLESDLVRVVVLVNRGADIHELVFKPRGVDVLYKSPWGLRGCDAALPADTSLEAWLDRYSGGWQVMLPNAGDACVYDGAVLPFHGEAAWSPWECEILHASGAFVEATMRVRLRRSPLLLERTMRLREGEPKLEIEERVTNLSGRAVPYIWGHHPAFGAPFLNDDCRLDTGARTVTTDSKLAGPHYPLEPGHESSWPTEANLSRIPGPGTRRQLLAFLSEFESGWFAITNRAAGFGVGITWPKDLLPYAWVFQEMHGTEEYPWFGDGYVMAVEPVSSIPARGLSDVIRSSGTNLVLGPHAHQDLRICAVFYEFDGGVSTISSEGVVTPA